MDGLLSFKRYYYQKKALELEAVLQACRNPEIPDLEPANEEDEPATSADGSDRD